MTDNSLTKTLELAATGKVSTVEFYQALMSVEIFAIGSIEGGTNDGSAQTHKSGTSFNIKNWMMDDENAIIPFFTSLEDMQKSVSSEESYVAMSAENFFQITKGTHLVLNPGSDYNKEFTPHEVSLLIGQPDDAGISKQTIEKETRAFVGQPAEYPHALVDALSQVLPLYKTIDRAYLAYVSTPEGELAATLMIGLEAQSEIGPLISELATHIHGKAPKEFSVAFMQVATGKEGVSEYMLERTKPFYDRSAPTNLASETRPAAKLVVKASKPWYKFWA